MYIPDEEKLSRPDCFVTEKREDYSFFYNTNHGAGEIHVGNYQIALSDEDATMFYKTKDEVVRLALVKKYVERYQDILRNRAAAARQRQRGHNG